MHHHMIHNNHSWIVPTGEHHAGHAPLNHDVTPPHSAHRALASHLMHGLWFGHAGSLPHTVHMSVDLRISCMTDRLAARSSIRSVEHLVQYMMPGLDSASPHHAHMPDIMHFFCSATQSTHMCSPGRALALPHRLHILIPHQPAWFVWPPVWWPCPDGISV